MSAVIVPALCVDDHVSMMITEVFEDDKKALEKQENRWCSWCQTKTLHVVSKRESVSPGRSIHVCTNCSGRTAVCVMPGCRAMARAHASWADKLCVVHDGTIPSWPSRHVNGTEIQHVSSGVKWCSWCFHRSDHTLRQSNILKRNVYACDHCKNRTLKCRKCNEAMSRGHQGWDDELCYKCDKTIAEWTRSGSDVKKYKTRIAWCSWCFCKTSHEHIQGNMLTRDVFSCVNCQGRTLPCVCCGVGMARGDLGLDELVCARCPPLSTNPIKLTKPPAWDWEEVQEKNRNIFALQRVNNVNSPGIDQRMSEFRTTAKRLNMERPFLLLVSMDPCVRWSVGCLLGKTYFTEPFFGDPHAEAASLIAAIAVETSWAAVLSRVLMATLRTKTESASSVELENIFWCSVSSLMARLPSMRPALSMFHVHESESDFLGGLPVAGEMSHFRDNMRRSGIDTATEIACALSACWGLHYAASKDSYNKYLPSLPGPTLHGLYFEHSVVPLCHSPSPAALPVEAVHITVGETNWDGCIPKNQRLRFRSPSITEEDSDGEYTEDDRITSEYLTTSGSDHDGLQKSNLDGSIPPLGVLHWLRGTYLEAEEHGGADLIDPESSGQERRLLFAVMLLMYQKMMLAAQGFTLHPE